jgi:hypothetical protein
MAQSYSNSGGQGRRDHRIIARTNFGLGNLGDSTAVFFVNGNIGNENCWFPSAGAGGLYIIFDFGSPKLVTEATWYQDNGTTHGTWKWQGSNDDSTYTDIGSSFTLGGTAQVHTQLNGNSTAYRYYKLVGVSGSASSSPYTREIEFKLDDLVSTTPDYGNSGGSGNRSGSITVTQSQTSGNGDLFVGRFGSNNPTLSLFVDGINRIDTSGPGALVFKTGAGAAASGRWVQFQFGAAVVIDQLRWFQDTADTHGTWKLQGSNDGSTWTDVGSPATLGGSVDTHARFNGFVDGSGTGLFHQSIFDGPNGNTTGYTYYRLLGVSGNVSGNPFIYEIAFRIGSPATPTAQVRVTQEVAEVVTEQATAALVRVTQEVAEVAVENNTAANVRVTQIFAEALVENTVQGQFFATANPLAQYLPAAQPGTFIASADPRAQFTPGMIAFTAFPVATFETIGNAYSRMGFTASAYPQWHFDKVVRASGFLMTGAPRLKWFTAIGQSGRCISGPGVGDRTGGIPANWVF